VCTISPANRSRGLRRASIGTRVPSGRRMAGGSRSFEFLRVRPVHSPRRAPPSRGRFGSPMPRQEKDTRSGTPVPAPAADSIRSREVMGSRGVRMTESSFRGRRPAGCTSGRWRRAAASRPTSRQVPRRSGIEPWVGVCIAPCGSGCSTRRSPVGCAEPLRTLPLAALERFRRLRRCLFIEIGMRAGRGFDPTPLGAQAQP